MTTQTKTTATPTKKQDHSYITKLPTFADRGTAIAKRLEEVKANPKYQALPEEHKAKVRADLYHKYVPASYFGFHLPIPEEKTWVEATGRDTNKIMSGKKLSETYGSQGTSSDYWRHDKESNQDLGAGFTKGVNELDLFGTKVARRTFLALHGLAEHFYPHETSIENGSTEHRKLEELNKSWLMRRFKNDEDTARAKIQDADFWLQTHPRDTVIGHLDGMVGEQLSQLPLYEAVGALGIGAKVGTAIGSKVPLTAKLVQSPVGKWVAKRLIDATDGFIISLATSGGSVSEAKSGAAGFAAGGVATRVVGKVLSKTIGDTIKVASAPLIKKWTATLTAMGGKPLAEELAHSAMAETEVEAAHEGEGLAHIKRVEEARSFIADTTKSAEARAEREQELGKLGAAQEERAAKIKAWKEKQEIRARLDPVLHKLHEGEKVSLNSIALATYQKNLNGLSKNQRALVLAKRMELIEQAANEAPVHLPELHRDEVKQQIDEARVKAPVMNSLMQEFEQMGVKFSEEIAEGDSKVIAQETGISNAAAAAKKVNKIAASVGKPKGEPITSARISLGQSDTLSYFRAPRNRSKFAEAVSDRSKGAFDKFYGMLKEANGDMPFRFETPQQRFLYNYHISKQLDAKTGRALREGILRQMSKFEDYKSFTLPQMREQVQKESAYFDNHLHTYARSGKLYNGDHIYATTQNAGRSSWTKWQFQNERDSDKVVQDSYEKALKQHPEALKALKTVHRTVQKERKKVTNPAEFEAYQAALDEANRIIKSFVKGGNPTLFK